jgi:hypothetical protein
MNLRTSVKGRPDMTGSPGETGAGPLVRGRRVWNAWLASAGSAIAIILVAAALLVTGGTHRPGTAAMASASVPAGPPKYYAEVEGKFIGWHGPNSVEALVRSTATGAAVARVPSPVIAAAPKALPSSVAAGSDDRTFYVAYRNWGGQPGDFWIYRFHVSAAGVSRPVPVSGGTVTGQHSMGNVGGFAVSPDGSRLALAVQSVDDGSSRSSAAGEILVLDRRTGARAVWRGGMDRARQTFGIEDLSWTGDSKSVAYLGGWCPPGGIGYGFTCSTVAMPGRHLEALGTDVMREIRVTSRGGALTAGRVLRAPAPVSVLGRVPTSLESLFGGEYLAVDRTGGYVLVWMAGNSTTGHPLHGWVRGGQYHQLAPTLPGHYPGGWIQMTW